MFHDVFSLYVSWMSSPTVNLILNSTRVYVPGFFFLADCMSKARCAFISLISFL